LQRPLGELDLRVIAIDGIIFRDHTILIALGVTANAEKVILGVHEGATENAGVVKALLRDLIERGLSTERALVFLIDGAKALRSAITRLFGTLALIHRCQVHKERNVLAHLPEALRPGTARALRDAYAATDAALAQRQLERLAGSLERDHPGAAASLRRPRRDAYADATRRHRLALPLPALDQPHREPQRPGRPLHPQRPPLARRHDDRALGRHCGA
jgi:transposase-like protein